MTSEIDLTSMRKRLESHVSTLARAPRNFGSAHHRVSADYILAGFRDIGWNAAKITSLKGEAPYVNVMAHRNVSAQDRLLVVGAHYDTLSGTPGADDNASGVAALLEIARFLYPRIHNNQKLQSSVQLVAYDREEDGFYGSRSHSRSLMAAGSPDAKMIALEMLGYASQRIGSQASPVRSPNSLPSIGNFIAVCGNEASRDLAEAVAAGLRRVPEQPVEIMVVSGNGEGLTEARSSDHSSFWDCGYQAAMVTDTAMFRNTNYHRESDTPDTLDYSFLTQVTLGLCFVVEAIVDIPTKATT